MFKLGEYNLKRCIGKGSFGEVYLSSSDKTDQLFAIKKMDKSYVNQPKMRKYFDNEVNILKEINHPNIVKLYEVKEDVRFYYLVTELCNGGGLSDCLENYQRKYRKSFDERTVQHLMKQIISGIQYIHSKKIIHRDLKLDNILVNFRTDKDKENINLLNADAKIIDFGFARHLGQFNLAYTTLGSPLNMDPKILNQLAKGKMSCDAGNGEGGGYDEKADIWSLGILCYEMIIGKATFESDTLEELLSKVENGSYTLPTSLSKEIVSFLNGMLQYDPRQRLSADQLANHQFLLKDVSQFTRMDLCSGKMNSKQIKLNVKQNQSIWALFDKNDEMKFTQIPGLMLQNQVNQNQNNHNNFQPNFSEQNKNIITAQNNINNNGNINEYKNINNAANYNNNNFSNEYTKKNEKNNYIPFTPNQPITIPTINSNENIPLAYNNNANNITSGNNNQNIKKDFHKKLTYQNQIPHQEYIGNPNNNPYMNNMPNIGFNGEYKNNQYPNFNMANVNNAVNTNMMPHSFNPQSNYPNSMNYQSNQIFNDNSKVVEDSYNFNSGSGIYSTPDSIGGNQNNNNTSNFVNMNQNQQAMYSPYYNLNNNAQPNYYGNGNYS